MRYILHRRVYGILYKVYVPGRGSMWRMLDWEWVWTVQCDAETNEGMGYGCVGVIFG